MADEEVKKLKLAYSSTELPALLASIKSDTQLQQFILQYAEAKGTSLTETQVNNLIATYIQTNNIGTGGSQGTGLTTEQTEKLAKILTNGTGDKFLSNDGTYKTVSSTGGTSIDDTTTTATDKTWSASKIKSEIDGVTVTDAQISGAVEDYLTENPPSGVTDEAISSAVSEYLTENPISGISETDQAKLDKIAIDGDKGLFLNQKGNYVDIEKDIVEEFAEDNTVWGANLPVIFIDGDVSQIGHNYEVDVTVQYVSQFKQFKDTATLELQGDSSLGYPKKSYTVRFATKHGFGWGKDTKWVLKANFTDHTHARNIVTERIWSQIVSARSDYEDLPEKLKESPMNGAVDGFPIRLYLNGDYKGLYTFNMPKGSFTLGMSKKNPLHIAIESTGNTYNSACFRSTTPTIVKNGGGEWQEIIQDAPIAGEYDKWIEIINFIKDSDNATFKAGLSNYFDVPSLIDYYILGYVATDLDGFGKNQIFMSYDGGAKFYVTAYDKDLTWGWHYQPISASYKFPEEYECGSSANGKGNYLYEKLEANFMDEIKERYAELRSSVLTASNILAEFEKFICRIPTEEYENDKALWTNISPNSNLAQIRQNVVARLAYVDTKLISTNVTSINVYDVSTRVGQTCVTAYSLLPAIANNYSLSYQIGNTAIATVSSDGVITGVSVGTTTITVTDSITGISGTANVEITEVTEDTVGKVYELLQSRAMNGTTDYIDTGVTLDKASDFTVVLEVIQGGTNVGNGWNEKGNYIFDNGNVSLAKGNTWMYSVYNGSNSIESLVKHINATPTYTLDSVNRVDSYYIIITREGSTLRLTNNKWNGSLSSQIGTRTTKTLSYTQGDSDMSFVIGSNVSHNKFWGGIVVSCEVYNKALTEDEITSKFDAWEDNLTRNVSITTNLTNVTDNKGFSTVQYNTLYDGDFSFLSIYNMSCTVTMDGVDISDDVVTIANETGRCIVKIPNTTGDVIITASCDLATTAE